MSIDENEFFREASVRICGSLDFEKAMARAFEYISRYIPLSEMYLQIIDLERNLVINVVTVTDGCDPGFGRYIYLPDENRHIHFEQMETGDSVTFINEPQKHPVIGDYCKRLGLDPYFSLILMRLELEGNLIGNLTFTVRGEGQYNTTHVKLVRLLLEPFTIAMANAIKHQEVLVLQEKLADDNRYLQRQLRSLYGGEIIGAEFGLRHVMESVRQVASLESPVLLLGETGTGKDVIANAIHYSSHRMDGPFIKVNCGAIPDTLVDSELFGHEKGAFTGALALKRGRFERADGGTIFLDEIGELPLQAQVRLLHVLQTRQIERVGGTSTIPVNIRIIVATNRNLETMVRIRQFREDLWFRINVFPIVIPPLRHRKEDIPALAHHFIDQKTIELKLEKAPVLAPGAMDTLQAYDWPGNVRELQNIVERALIRQRGGVLSFDDLGAPLGSRETEEGRSTVVEFPSLDDMMRRHIQTALSLAHGRVNGSGGAAEMLGVHPNTLRKRMRKLVIPFGRKAKTGG